MIGAGLAGVTIHAWVLQAQFDEALVRSCAEASSSRPQNTPEFIATQRASRLGAGLPVLGGRILSFARL